MKINVSRSSLELNEEPILQIPPPLPTPTFNEDEEHFDGVEEEEEEEDFVDHPG